MDNELSQFYLKQQEPVKSCLLALRDIILAKDCDITTSLKYGMPFFSYKGKMFCYLWVHKKHHHPYIGFVEGKHLYHPDLLEEKRARMKILLINPTEDFPMVTIDTLLKEALSFYTKDLLK